MIKDPNKEPISTEVVIKKAKTALGGGRGTFALAVIGSAISLASSFMFCLASISFDFTQLQLGAFWSRWASMAISTLFTYALALIHKDEVNRLNKWYVENLSYLADKSKTVGVEFEIFLQEFNLQRRIEWHKRKINNKLGKLNQKFLRLQLKNKSTEKVAIRIEKYKHLISTEYIEANKYALKTRSRTITSAQVLTETQRGNDGEENFRSTAAYYGGKAVTKLILSLLITICFASVVVQNFTAGIDVAAITMTILMVLSLLISVVSAVMAANGCYKNVYVPNLQFKLKIISSFEDWKESRK